MSQLRQVGQAFMTTMKMPGNKVGTEGNVQRHIFLESVLTKNAVRQLVWLSNVLLHTAAAIAGSPEALAAYLATSLKAL